MKTEQKAARLEFKETRCSKKGQSRFKRGPKVTLDYGDVVQVAVKLFCLIGWERGGFFIANSDSRKHN